MVAARHRESAESAGEDQAGKEKEGVGSPNGCRR
jgi:hypothetical protein